MTKDKYLPPVHYGKIPDRPDKGLSDSDYKIMKENESRKKLEKHLKETKEYKSGGKLYEYVSFMWEIIKAVDKVRGKQTMPNTITPVDGDDEEVLELCYRATNWTLLVTILNNYNVEWFFKNFETGKYAGEENVSLEDAMISLAQFWEEKNE